MFCFSKLLETNTMEHHFSTRVYTQKQNQNESNLLISLAFFLFVTLMYGFMALSVECPVHSLMTTGGMPSSMARQMKVRRPACVEMASHFSLWWYDVCFHST